MKAVTCSRYGPPEVLRLEDVPIPEVGEREVLVKIHATTVNDWDWGFVRGKPYVLRAVTGLTRPRVNILGAEVAGVVKATGPGVTRLQPGDRVYGDISEAGFGGWAEYVSVTEDALFPMSPSMTFEQAAALPHAAGLAMQGLVDVGKIRQGDRVLINGAGGGVGTIGLQIAKRYEAEVTGVDAGFKLDAMKSLGFDHVIDYREEDFTQRGLLVDLILDTKSNRPPSSYRRVLDVGGRYVTVGGELPRLIQIFAMGALISRYSNHTIKVVGLDPNKDLDYVNEIFESGGLEILIDGPFPLNETPEAVRRFGEARHIGKVVISHG